MEASKPTEVQTSAQEFLSFEMVAEAIGLPERELVSLCSHPDFPKATRRARIIGGRIANMWNANEIAAWIEERRRIAAMPLLFCKDCANFREAKIKDFSRCLHKSVSTIDLVHGYQAPHCSNTRAQGGPCGPEGKLFEQKNTAPLVADMPLQPVSQTAQNLADKYVEMVATMQHKRIDFSNCKMAQDSRMDDASLLNEAKRLAAADAEDWAAMREREQDWERLRMPAPPTEASPRINPEPQNTFIELALRETDDAMPYLRMEGKASKNSVSRRAIADVIAEERTDFTVTSGCDQIVTEDNSIVPGQIKDQPAKSPASHPNSDTTVL